MIEGTIGINSNTFIQLMNEFTLITLIISLSIFSFVVLRSRSNIKTFQTQILLFVVLYLIGEVIEDANLNILSSFPELGSQIHIVATVFLVVLFWTRFYYSVKHDTRMVDDDMIDEGGVKQ